MSDVIENLKVVLLGESGVGKTSIISRFTEDKFDKGCESSLAAQFTSKTVPFSEENLKIKFDIWDTAGQERFRSLAKLFYKDARVIIFVYDITSLKSFKEMKDYWYNETREKADTGVIFAVVGNKIDLYENQEVDENLAKLFAEEIGAIYQLTSAFNSSGIGILFENIGKKYMDPNFDYKKKDEDMRDNYNKNKQDENQNNSFKLKKENENTDQEENKLSKESNGCKC